MDEPKNRRTDQQGPKTPLRWGERWTLLLTSPTSGVVGQYGATWPGQPAHYERVNVYAEGTAKLDDIEQYRLQMAAIGTAAIGYWKLGDSIHPDYDTVPLRDVAALHARYDDLSRFRESVRGMVQLLKNREWAEDLAATGDAAELQSAITELVGARLNAPAPSALAVEVMGCFNAAEIEGLSTVLAETTDARLKDLVERRLMHALYAAQQAVAVPDAVDAAMTDAIVHGTGAFTVKADGSTEHVDLQAQNRAAAEIVAFSPPAGVRDALYRDYVVPTGHASPATCISPGCQAPVTNRLLESCEVHAAEFRDWQNNRDKEGGPE